MGSRDLGLEIDLKMQRPLEASDVIADAPDVHLVVGDHDLADHAVDGHLAIAREEGLELLIQLIPELDVVGLADRGAGAVAAPRRPPGPASASSPAAALTGGAGGNCG